MIKPEDIHYHNDVGYINVSAWVFVFFIIFLYVTFEVNNLKKEVLIKYFNGSDKKDIILPFIFTNSVTIISSALIGMLLAQLVTESSKFLLISLVIILFIVLSTIFFYF